MWLLDFWKVCASLHISTVTCPPYHVQFLYYYTLVPRALFMEQGVMGRSDCDVKDSEAVYWVS